MFLAGSRSSSRRTAAGRLQVGACEPLSCIADENQGVYQCDWGEPTTGDALLSLSTAMPEMWLGERYTLSVSPVETRCLAGESAKGSCPWTRMGLPTPEFVQLESALGGRLMIPSARVEVECDSETTIRLGGCNSVSCAQLASTTSERGLFYCRQQNDPKTQLLLRVEGGLGVLSVSRASEGASELALQQAWSCLASE